MNSLYNQAMKELRYGNTYGAKRILREMEDARSNAFLWMSTDKRYTDRLISNLEREIHREESIAYDTPRIKVEPIAVDGKTFIIGVVVLLVVGIIASIADSK